MATVRSRRVASSAQRKREDSVVNNVSNSYDNSINNVSNSFDSAISNSFSAELSAALSISKTKIKASIDNSTTNVDKSVNSYFQNVDNSIGSLTVNIETLNQSQQNVNQNMKKTVSLADTLKSAFEGVKQVAGKVGEVFEMSDQLTITTRKIESINDGSMTTKDLQDKIFQAAQKSRTSYDATVDTVIQLSTEVDNTFSNPDEAVAFTEQMNKQFKLGGASSDEQAGYMDQLIGSMASGDIDGGELDALLQQAPNLGEALANTLGTSVDQLEEMANNGQITGDVMKVAVLTSAEETNNKFAELKPTFGEVWQTLKDKAMNAFTPILEKISEITQSKGFNNIIRSISIGIMIVAAAASTLYDIISVIGGTIADNWSMLEPLILGIASAIGIYVAAMLVVNGLEAFGAMIKFGSALAQAVKIAFTKSEAKANEKLAITQWGLNSAILACPIFWIIAAIIALIAIFYVAIAAINKFTGSTLSATGLIMGAIFVAGAAIANGVMGTVENILGYIEYVINQFVAFANFFANVFNDPVGSIIKLFGDLADNVLGFIEKIASGLDFVFKTDFADTIKGWRADLEVMTQAAFDEHSNGSYEEKFPEIDMDEVLEKFGIDFEKFDLGEAWDKGYTFGEGIEDKFGGLLDGGFNTDGLFDDLEIPEIGNNTANTANNTAAMSDSMDSSNEELSWMRTLAEQEALNQFTTAEIKLEMNNNNNISSELDLDGVVSYMEEKLYESMVVAAEGVHS